MGSRSRPVGPYLPQHPASSDPEVEDRLDAQEFKIQRSCTLIFEHRVRVDDLRKYTAVAR
jgi:hypothetical protein